jgi:hypothetical protein
MTSAPAKTKYRRSTDPLLARLKASSKLPPKYGDVTGRLDPYEVYRVRARERAKVAEPGIESFAYNVFGPDLIASLALAIDPIDKFRFTGAKITSINRTRKFTSIWPQTRSFRWTTDSEYCSNGPDLTTPDQFDRTPVSCTTTRIYDSTTPLLAQAGYSGFIADTTIRTRPVDSKIGEMELFAPYLDARPRKTSIVDIIVSRAASGPYTSVADSRKTYTFTGKGPGLRIDPAYVDTVLSGERASEVTYRSKYGFGLLRDTMPTHPEFSSFYNLVELKDIPHMMQNTVKLLKDFQGVLSKPRGVADQYLNLKFGWEATLDAIKDLLYSPTRIAKRINYLISRRGKPTTYRTRRNFLDDVPSVPPAEFNLMASWESLKSSGYKSQRKVELRLMLNATLEFPEVIIPEVRSDLWTELLGANPTPTDVYNLVPWSWLADWFSGLGDYLSLIDRVSRDPALINYGFFSYVSSGKINYSYVTQQTNDETYILPPAPTVVNHTTFTYPYSAEFGYRYHRRRDVTTIGDVKAVSLPSTLAADQLAIIGALLTKWFHN